MTTIAGSIAPATAPTTGYFLDEWTVYTVWHVSGEEPQYGTKATPDAAGDYSINDPDIYTRDIEVVAFQPLGTPWQASDSVAAGDYRHPSAGISDFVLRCTTGGTTDGTEPTWGDPTHGDTIAESGDVEWVVINIRGAASNRGMPVQRIVNVSGDMLSPTRTGRVLFFDFKTKDGANLDDLSGNGNDGTPGSDIVIGDSGLVVFEEELGSYIDVSHSAELKNATQTIIVCGTCETFNDRKAMYFIGSGTGFNTQEGEVGLDADQKLSCQFVDGVDQTFTLKGATTIEPGQLIVAALEKNGRAARFMLNGVEDASTTLSFDPYMGTNPITIGRVSTNPSGQRHLKGVIFCAIVDNTVFTDAEHLAIADYLLKRYPVG